MHLVHIFYLFAVESFEPESWVEWLNDHELVLLAMEYTENTSLFYVLTFILPNLSFII